jgi:hypothetical protein
MGKDKAEKKAREMARRASLTPEERAKEDKSRKRVKLIVLLILTVTVMIGLLVPDPKPEQDTGKSSSAIVSDESGVEWSNYAPSVKTRIMSFIQSGDCVNLQSEFDIADQNDTAQRNRVGVGNADLMDYLDKEMQKLGCY